MTLIIMIVNNILQTLLSSPSLSAMVNLAADHGWGPRTLLLIFLVTVTIAAAVFLTVIASSRLRPQSFVSKSKYRIEMYWSIGTAAVLIWLYAMSYPWMPPVAFSTINSEKGPIQQVNITAGQWFWLMSKEGGPPLKVGTSPHITLIAGQPVKFVAHSVDVNHGFGVFSGSNDGAPILLQMQVIPNLDNVFYYTFKQPGVYMVRCLEYCGYAHPYMTSEITVLPSALNNNEGGGIK
ncbi:MAG: hypothetical protein M3Y53_07340 [Thermoproteota archaeon]|nr:hypothetical protein [Thermoproteota archaeon]